MCRSASFALWKIGKLSNLLDHGTTEKFIHAFVTSCLDYCNSLLFGLPAQEIKKLQLIQNSAARLVTMTRKYSHIMSVLQWLHWLSIQQCMKFKILCIIHKILYGVAPVYLEELLSHRDVSRNLWKNVNGEIYLTQHFSCNNSYGRWAFSVRTPDSWNSLPREIPLIYNFVCFKS